jgi:hypothetical protein
VQEVRVLVGRVQRRLTVRQPEEQRRPQPRDGTFRTVSVHCSQIIPPIRHKSSRRRAPSPEVAASPRSTRDDSGALQRGAAYYIDFTPMRRERLFRIDGGELGKP